MEAVGESVQCANGQSRCNFLCEQSIHVDKHLPELTVDIIPERVVQDQPNATQGCYPFMYVSWSALPC